MLGAIIGDMAADLWQRDKTKFYRQLIDDKASLSEYGKAVVKFAPKVMRCESIEREEFGRPSDSEECKSLSLLAFIVQALCGWADNNVGHVIELTWTCRGYDYFEKESYYAKSIIATVICLLRQGKTKAEVRNQIGADYPFLANWSKGEDGLFGAFLRAWDAFYRAFDFTSTIHIAVKSPINPRLTASLAGLIAQAMYGCEQILLKKKYSDTTYSYIGCPRKDLEKIWSELRNHDEQMRMFFPKNRALTNVERHTWTTIHNPYAHIHFGEELYQKIRMALDTGWENRYGIYLDDGWYYVYRSGFLMFRFKIAEMEIGYKINVVQRSEDGHANDYTALIEALYSIERPPYKEVSTSIVLQPQFSYKNIIHL